MAHPSLSSFGRATRDALLAIVVIVGASFPSALRAATLNVSASPAQIAVDDIAVIEVFASSPEQAMNAFSGVLEVPRTLEIIDVSNPLSPSQIWIQRPVVTERNVTFAGVILNPGFTGARRHLFQISVRGATPGDAIINLSSAKILANDGKGTDILTGTRGVNITVLPNPKTISPEDKPTAPKTPSEPTPAPTSSAHVQAPSPRITPPPLAATSSAEEMGGAAVSGSPAELSAIEQRLPPRASVALNSWAPPASAPLVSDRVRIALLFILEGLQIIILACACALRRNAKKRSHPYRRNGA